MASFMLGTARIYIIGLAMFPIPAHCGGARAMGGGRENESQSGGRKRRVSVGAMAREVRRRTVGGGRDGWTGRGGNAVGSKSTSQLQPDGWCMGPYDIRPSSTTWHALVSGWH